MRVTCAVYCAATCLLLVAAGRANAEPVLVHDLTGRIQISGIQVRPIVPGDPNSGLVGPLGGIISVTETVNGMLVPPEPRVFADLFSAFRATAATPAPGGTVYTLADIQTGSVAEGIFLLTNLAATARDGTLDFAGDVRLLEQRGPTYDQSLFLPGGGVLTGSFTATGLVWDQAFVQGGTAVGFGGTFALRAPAAVPEPPALALLAGGAAMLLAIKMRRLFRQPRLCA